MTDLSYIYGEILAAYRRSWQVVTDQEAALVNDPRSATQLTRLRAMRANIEAEMDYLVAITRSWAESQFPTAYAAGGVLGARGSGGAFVWTDTHRAAVQAAAEEVYGDLLGSTQFVRTSTKDLIKRLAKQSVLDKIIKADTPSRASRAMAQLLADHGVTAVVYRDGSRRGLAEYAQMTMRTATALSYNTATLRVGSELGTKYWEVFDGPGCGLDNHDSIPAVNGMILDEESAFAHPLSHPQCSRSFGPRPDLDARTAKQLGLVTSA